jgi:hypothetical protein
MNEGGRGKGEEGKEGKEKCRNFQKNHEHMLKHFKI